MRIPLLLIWIGFKAALAGFVVWAASWMGAGLSLAVSGGIAAAASFLLAVRWGLRASVAPSKVATFATCNSAYFSALLAMGVLAAGGGHPTPSKETLLIPGATAVKSSPIKPVQALASCVRAALVPGRYPPLSAGICRSDFEVIHQ